MPVDRSRIRVKTFAVIVNADATLHAVARMSTAENPVLHRPLGGSIELGERSRDAVIREIREELDATFVRPELLGVLENIFMINGEPGHEVVFVYGGRLAEPDVVPPTGRTFTEGWVEWRPIGAQAEPPLFPEGLQSLIDDWVISGGPRRHAEPKTGRGLRLALEARGPSQLDDADADEIERARGIPENQ